MKATIVTNPYYYNNRLFAKNDKISNRDNCLYAFYLLKEKFKEYGVDLSTPDINPISESEFVIYNEFPKNNIIFSNKNNYLLILEPEIIRPDNWKTDNHKKFKKIFTWNDTLVDNNKYFKINYSYKIPVEIPYNISKKDKLCTIIAGHKFKKHKYELYTERVKAIRWFEQNHPEDFDLYGMGWDKYYFKGLLSHFNKIEFLTRIFKDKYPSYKGSVVAKRDILEKYKFSICYENVRGLTGYITEKIFDCFFAGCIPIYWGAPNISDHIPIDSYIDRNKFSSYEELYFYLLHMTDSEYLSYITAIERFIKSDMISQFSANVFSDTIVNNILTNTQ